MCSISQCIICHTLGLEATAYKCIGPVSGFAIGFILQFLSPLSMWTTMTFVATFSVKKKPTCLGLGHAMMSPWCHCHHVIACIIILYVHLVRRTTPWSVQQCDPMPYLTWASKKSVLIMTAYFNTVGRKCTWEALVWCFVILLI